MAENGHARLRAAGGFRQTYSRNALSQWRQDVAPVFHRRDKPSGFIIHTCR